tara:strand:+ start:540 stop:977 length:438 start_codon:yes stop_codon:yes gene_type:complete
MGRKKKYTKKKNEYIYIPPKVEYVYNSNYKLKVDNSLIKHGGLGVFTEENIPKDTLIGEYIGEKKHIDEPVLSCYCLTLKSDYYIDAYDYPRGILAMINDCRFSDYKYNCSFKVYKDKAEVWSISDIEKNRELYLDYGNEYWKHR